MDAEEAKTKNIIIMSFGFSAMSRLLEKGEHKKVIEKLGYCLPKLAISKDKSDFQTQHDSFCDWFCNSIKTAERKEKLTGIILKKSDYTSYGQGAKILDVALKTYVYYCQLPDIDTAQRTCKLLNAAIDTKMIKHLKIIFPESSLTAVSIEDVDKSTYFTLQELVRKDISLHFRSEIIPVQWDDIMWRELNKKI